MPPDRIDFAPFALDRVNECLWQGSRAIKLRPKAFAVLQHLLARPGQLVTKEHLLAAVWPDTFVGDAVLKVAVRQIREALSDDSDAPRFIETAHRRGYRFIGSMGAASTTDTRDAAPVSSAASLPEGTRSRLPAGFVGRDHALGRLEQWLEKSRRGERQVVFVTGEAGIGKTTLLDTFARTAAADPAVRICSGQCLEQYGMGEPYLPVLEAVRHLCRDEPDAIQVLRSHAPMWLLQMPSLVNAADREAIAREASGGTRERMLREMGEVLDALAARAPVVLVLEDLHWSDVSTLDLISYVARRRRPAHLMLLATFRPAELIASGHPLKRVQRELLARGLCEELALDYLSDAAVGEHLGVRFPAHQFPVELATLIHERTEGNPLFMVNTIDYLVAAKSIEPHADGWRMSASLDAVKVGVPDSIRHVVETQIERLEPADQRLLEAASVAGAEFSVAALSAAVGDGSTDVETRCEALSRRQQFIRECGSQVLPNGQTAGRFGFVHAVYRHVLYERLSASRRSVLHRRLGEGAQRVYGEQASEIAAELAMHFERAGDYEPAARYLQLAAANATQRAAYSEAIALCRRALDLLARVPDSDARARLELHLHLTLGVPLIATEGYPAASVGVEYQRARELCNRLAPTQEISQVLWGLWTFHALRGELATALDIATDMLVLGEGAADAPMTMRAHWSLEITCTHRGEFALALDHFRSALALYESDRLCVAPFSDALDAGVTTRCFASWSLWCRGEIDSGLARIEEAVALARKLSEPHGLAHALVFAAVVHQLRREPAEAQRYAAAALDVAFEHGLLLYEGMARLIRGWSLIHRGAAEAAVDQIRQGLAGWQKTGAQLMIPYYLALLAEALGAAGQHAAAVETIDRALAHAARSGECFYDAELHRLKGQCIIAAAPAHDRDREAQACFEASLAIAGRQGARSLALRTALSLARLHSAQGLPHFADALVRPIYDTFAEGLDTLDLRDARALLDAASHT